jgi:hypothetical protein
LIRKCTESCVDAGIDSFLQAIGEMGSTFTTVFESEVAPYGRLGSDHRTLLDARDELDQLAEENGLTSLLAFESYAPEDTEGLLDEETQAAQPPAAWFAPNAGLAAVDALWDYLENHPGVLDEQSEVMADLSETGEELEAAQRAGVRFRFAVVM